jgi:hypothetical protein
LDWSDGPTAGMDQGRGFRQGAEEEVPGVVGWIDAQFDGRCWCGRAFLGSGGVGVGSRDEFETGGVVGLKRDGRCSCGEGPSEGGLADGLPVRVNVGYAGVASEGARM